MDIKFIKEQFEIAKKASHLSDTIVVDTKTLEWLITEIELYDVCMDRAVEIDEEKNKEIKDLKDYIGQLQRENIFLHTQLNQIRDLTNKKF